MGLLGGKLRVLLVLGLKLVDCLLAVQLLAIQVGLVDQTCDDHLVTDLEFMLDALYGLQKDKHNFQVIHNFLDKLGSHSFPNYF